MGAGVFNPRILGDRNVPSQWEKERMGDRDVPPPTILTLPVMVESTKWLGSIYVESGVICYRWKKHVSFYYP